MYVTPSTHPGFPADIQNIIWITTNIIIFAKYLYLLIYLVLIHFIIMTSVKKESHQKKRVNWQDYNNNNPVVNLEDEFDEVINDNSHIGRQVGPVYIVKSD